MARITDSEMYEMVKSLAAGTAITSDEADTITTWADNKIASLVNRAAKQKERDAAKPKETDPLLDVVTQVLKDNPTKDFLPAEVLDMVEGEDLSAAKIRARFIKLVKSGVAVKTEREVEGKTYAAYKLA